MNFILNNTYCDLPRDFFIFRNVIFYRNGNEINNIDENKSLVLEKDTYINIIGLNKEFLYYLSDSHMYKYNLENCKAIITPLPRDSKLQIKSIYKDKYIIRYKRQSEDWKIRCLDINGAVIWELDEANHFNSTVIEDNFIINYLERKSLANYDMVNLKCKWQHSYSDLLEIENPDVIGLYSDIIRVKDNLYLYIAGRDKNGKENQGTYCINIETGKIKYIYKNIISYFYPENNLLYNLYNNKLNILNTITQEIEKIDFSEEFTKYNIHTDSKFVVQDGLVYFTQSMGDIVAKVGVLSPKERKLLWKYDFPKSSGAVGSMQVQGDRVYVHTQDKTLHIFEKEKE